MESYNGIPVPASGESIEYRNARLAVPDQPIIPYIVGDGVGPDIWRAARVVFDAAVHRAYGGRRAVAWYEVLAGEKAFRQTGSWLPEETVEAIRRFRFAIKGPLTTPVGGGIRSLNVTLRQVLNLYVCMRPVKYYPGVPSPMKHPERLDVVIFRENTEDVYAGIEWREGSPEARKVIAFLEESLGVHIRPDSGLGVKPMSEGATKKLVRRAIQYALNNRRRSVVLVHKGNIMKYTEGAFRDWGYQLAAEEFAAECVREAEGAHAAPGQVIIKDRIADSMFQQILLRPDEYDVIATSNLNGDYLSDACAAQTGGLGMAPGANLGDGYGVFEATHGTAPKYANQDAVNPGSLILSGVLLFEHLGWAEAARLIEKSLTETIRQRKVTYDLHRQMEGASLMKTSEFAQAMVSNMALLAAA